jgi:hypothetical protein
MSTAQAPHLVKDDSAPKPERLEVTVIEHSSLFYWWPVWLLGYALALLTWMDGTQVADEMIIHRSKNLGIVFCMVLFLVLLMTNITLRGLASGIAIMVVLFLTVLFAYLDWWDDIMEYFGAVAIYMNFTFYFFFSTLILVSWLLAVFVFDRMYYWKFRPGQAVRYMFFGGGEHAYDTIGMSVYKLRDDVFRHWILGFGSGDLHIVTPGANKREYILHNVLFIGHKVDQIQQAMAMKPDEARDMVTTGGPS